MPFLGAAEGPVIQGLFGLGGSLAGAGIQASSNNQAIAAQQEALNKALAFEQQKYGDLQARVKPWISSGQSANQRMAQLLHLSDPGVSTSGSGPIPVAALSNGNGPGKPPSFTPLGGGVLGDPNNPQPGEKGDTGDKTGDGFTPPDFGAVLMEAPDGSVQHVDARHVNHYLSHGARKVS